MRPDARELYDEAIARFATHDYAGAVDELEAGYALDPRREFLFAEAQAKRLGGDCRGAVLLYQRFLTTHPPNVQINATQIALARCAQELARRPEVLVVTPPPAAPPDRPAPPRWWSDPLGLTAAAGAVVGIGLGIGFLAAASAARSDADGATTLADYTSRWSTAETRLAAGLTALAVGGTLGAAAALRFVVVRRRAHATTTLAPWVAAGGAGVGGTF